MADTVYMDHNATTRVRPEAAEAMLGALSGLGNASSVHAEGRAARRVIEDARLSIGELVGAPAGSVIFTSGGTEANNLALRGSAAGTVIASSIEHASVLAVSEGYEKIPVGADGVIDIKALDGLLHGNGKGAVVAIMLANNETGVLQPVKEAAAIARNHGALVHCDAIQAAGKIPVDFVGLGVDFLSLSAHKLGGPQGVGALVVRGGLEIASLTKGGGQENRRRCGTENLPGIAAFGAAAAAAGRDLGEFAKLSALRDRIEAQIAAEAPATFIGADAERLPNTACISMPGVTSDTQVISFDLAGIAVSAGSACSSGKVEPSHVLAAMGLSDAEATTAIRVSLGWPSGEEDVERFIGAWIALFRWSGERQALAV